MFIVYSLALNTQLTAYAQKYENITILAHSLDYTHDALSIFNFALANQASSIHLMFYYIGYAYSIISHLFLALCNQL